MEAHPLYIDGRWRSTGAVSRIVNPYTHEPVGEVHQASPADIHDAIRAASKAFDSTRRLQAFERTAILGRISDGIAARREECARLITRETGKPIQFSRAEVERSIFTFRVAAEEAGRMEGSVLPLDLAPHSAGRTGFIRHFPIGPIAAITPFNFPLNLVAHKVAPAIASGNPVVLKPSSAAPLTALLLSKIVEESGIPGGALNTVVCKSNDAEQLIVSNDVRLISFTGSPQVGWSLKSKAGKKKVTLELGGNAAVIVDAGIDVSKIVRRIAMGSFGNAGQSCIAVQRILVHNTLLAPFTDTFIEETGRIVVGDPGKDETVVGPMITESAAIKVEGWINDAIKAGARLLWGGKREGAVLAPTVLTDVNTTMNVCAEEVFAPVVTIEGFGSFSQAVAMVNDSKYGLQAGLFSDSMSHVLEAYESLEVGGVVINDYPTFRIDHMPYGGVKDSGFGREGIRYAMAEMTEPRLLVLSSSG